MSEQVSFDLVLKNAIQIPMVRIDRNAYLRKELTHRFDKKTVEKAIAHNPAYAGITIDQIDEIAWNAINHETATVTTLSFAAGIPGGFAMAGTVPADLAQYTAHLLRIMQKLAYLYGWPSLIDNNEEGAAELDDETTSLLTLFAGIMFGVQGASAAINKIAAQTAEHVAKSFAQKALTKGMVYPVVKKVATMLGVHMTKQIFARGVSKVIPIIGGVASGGLTFATYRPMAIKLKKHLAGLKTADSRYYQQFAEEATAIA